MEIFAAVAQLDRVLGYEPRGRGFDSCQPRQNTVKGRLRTSFFFVKTKDWPYPIDWGMHIHQTLLITPFHPHWAKVYLDRR